MTQKKGTTLLLILSVTLFFLASIVVRTVRAPPGPSYTLGASPSVLNEEEGNVIITFTITGGTANTAYTFRFTMSKPGGAGQAYVDESFPTDATGGYTQVLTYPNNTQTWNPITGTVRTDLPGNYTVTVVETAPKSVTTGFPSATVRVTSVLNVRLITPTQGSTIQRETTAYFTATVNDVDGQQVKDAQVSVSLPTGGQLALAPTTPSGTYSGSYRVQRSDSLGLWNISASAYSPAPSTTNNFGTYSVQVTVSPSQLVVSSLSTYNQYGTPTGDFSPGNTLYASFTVGYPTGGYLTTGSFTIHVEDPSGTSTMTLSSIYDSYGNTGPTATITYRFVIHQQQNQVVISPFYYVIAALAIGGSLGTTVFLKRFNSTTGPFDDLFKLTVGEMQPPATLMIVSDSGAGSTTMALQLLYRD